MGGKGEVNNMNQEVDLPSPLAKEPLSMTQEVTMIFQA